MNFHIITLFPGAFGSYVNESILARALSQKLLKFHFYNPRDFVVAKKKKASKNDFPEYRRIDDKPYGGGPGMVIQALPVLKVLDKAVKQIKKNKKAKYKIFFLEPAGKQFETTIAKKLAQNYSDIVIICGRYEGIDVRIKKYFKMEDLSVGPFVLTGGELPALIIMDCVARQIEGVLGDINSLEEERISSPEIYTRPEVLEFKGKKTRVPKVLLSGNHKLIDEWRTAKKGK